MIDETDLSKLSSLWASQAETDGSAKKVYETLRQAILEQVLPPGQRLGEAELAENLGVSRTPIREALTRLETQGLVERSSMRTVTVSRLSPKAIAEVLEVREWLDGVVAYLATGRITPPRLAELRWINERMRSAVNDNSEPETLEQINQEFHDILATAADNAFLASLMAQARDRVKPVTGSTFGYEDRAAEALAEHETIIEHIAAGDAESAARAARRHMDQAAKTRMAMIQERVDEPTGSE